LSIAAELRRVTSHVDLLSDCQGVIDLNAEVAHRTLNFRMAPPGARIASKGKASGLRRGFSHDQDPKLSPTIQLFCAAKSLLDHLVGGGQ
jgi:hypothetical protein